MDDINYIIIDLFKRFNKISIKQKHVINVKKFKLTKKYDSLDLINLSTCLDEICENQNMSKKLISENLRKIFSNYKSIYDFIKIHDKKN